MGKISHYINGLSPYPDDYYKKKEDKSEAEEDFVLNDRPVNRLENTVAGVYLRV